MASTINSDTLDVLKNCVKTLEDKKAADIRVLKVAGKSTVTDFFIIATGTSEPHLRALRNAIYKELKSLKVKNLHIDYEPESGWAVVDGFDFMVHLFLEEERELFALEALWKDGKYIPLEKLK